ncbi:MAG: hypothetical protein O6920_06390 [Chloroflexi bacterium]|nr:hypothetical protein [Chloroflexota bacterium]
MISKYGATRKRVRWLLFGSGFGLLLMIGAACSSDNGGSSELSINVPLVELNSSGQTGTATLRTGSGDTTGVTLRVTAWPRDPQPVHIHDGTCDNLGGIAYRLKDVNFGDSETPSVKVKLDALRTGNFAINLHDSLGSPEVYTACGNIPALPAP